MATLEERVAFLEGRVVEHSGALDGVRGAVVSLEQRLDRRFEALEQRMDRRFEDLEQRMDRRFEDVDRRIDGLDTKLSRHFTWLVGIQVTMLVAMVAALLAR
ncbi:MAG: hypothetical protein HYZ58_13625 [Acidobacteria bacterium]|nr:hypothetical protein [Acidobacteriota bacterium]MBI3264171.1 hypothetical protein [Acidobacteriota bacterium]